MRRRIIMKAKDDYYAVMNSSGAEVATVLAGNRRKAVSAARRQGYQTARRARLVGADGYAARLVDCGFVVSHTSSKAFGVK